MNKYLEKIAMRADVKHLLAGAKKPIDAVKGAVRKAADSHYASHAKMDGLQATREGVKKNVTDYRERLRPTKNAWGQPIKNPRFTPGPSRNGPRIGMERLKNYVRSQKDIVKGNHASPGPIPTMNSRSKN